MIRTAFGVIVSLFLLPASTSSGQAPSQSPTVATIDDERITLAELKQFAGLPLATLEEQAFKLQQQKLDQLIADRLLAREGRRRQMTLEDLIDSEVSARVSAVSAEEVHTFYVTNQVRLKKPESEMQEAIRAFLHNQRLAARREEFIASLQAQATVTVDLTPPLPFRATVGDTGPSRGMANARITIVAFEDFHCPYCKQVNETLERVIERYKGQVRFVHRDFPLAQLHPTAPRAHEAARCADKGGRFWEYRILLYANAPAASPEQLGGYAAQVGLDVAAFKQCLDSGESRAVVQKDEAEATRLGLKGTPAFFINGRLLSGAQPESEFVRVIDEELRRRIEP